MGQTTTPLKTLHRISYEFVRKPDNRRAVVSMFKTLIENGKSEGRYSLHTFEITVPHDFERFTYVESPDFKYGSSIDGVMLYLKNLGVKVEMKDTKKGSFQIFFNIPLELAKKRLPTHLATEAEKLSPHYENESLSQGRTSAALPQAQPPPVAQPGPSPAAALVSNGTVSPQGKVRPVKEEVIRLLQANNIPFEPYSGKPPQGTVSTVAIKQEYCKEAERLFMDMRWQYRKADAKSSSSLQVFRFFEGVWGATRQASSIAKSGQPVPAGEAPGEPGQSSTGVAKRLLRDLDAAGFVLVKKSDPFCLIPPQGRNGAVTVAPKNAASDDVLRLIRQSLRSDED